jgi:hypothetical protein
MMESTTTLVRAAAAKKLLFLPHAMLQMARPDRMISTLEVQDVVMTGCIMKIIQPIRAAQVV